MKKVALLVLVFFVGGCGEQSKNSLGDDNLQLARKFLALASSDEKRALNKVGSKINFVPLIQQLSSSSIITKIKDL